MSQVVWKIQRRKGHFPTWMDSSDLFIFTSFFLEVSFCVLSAPSPPPFSSQISPSDIVFSPLSLLGCFENIIIIMIDSRNCLNHVFTMVMIAQSLQRLIYKHKTLQFLILYKLLLCWTYTMGGMSCSRPRPHSMWDSLCVGRCGRGDTAGMMNAWA